MPAPVMQDGFLNAVIREKAMLTVFLMNGFQLKGVMTGFDHFTVLIETDGKQQLVYKHAISTIVPDRQMV